MRLCTHILCDSTCSLSYLPRILLKSEWVGQKVKKGQKAQGKPPDGTLQQIMQKLYFAYIRHRYRYATGFVRNICKARRIRDANRVFQCGCISLGFHPLNGWTSVLLQRSISQKWWWVRDIILNRYYIYSITLSFIINTILPLFSVVLLRCQWCESVDNCSIIIVHIVIRSFIYSYLWSFIVLLGCGYIHNITHLVFFPRGVLFIYFFFLVCHLVVLFVLLLLSWARMCVHALKIIPRVLSPEISCLSLKSLVELTGKNTMSALSH